MSDSEVDRELVRRVQNGEKDAFDVLVLKYQHKLLKLISRYVRDSSEALDVAQESFLEAYRALPNFRGESAFYTWLYRIAINTAKNHLVSESRRPPVSDVDAVDAEQLNGASDLKEYATPERLLLKEEIQNTVAAAIGDLCQRRSKSTPLAGVKMHHLMRFSPALAVVPVVHRRDARCFV